MKTTVLEEIAVASWNGPYPPELCVRARSALENGNVVFFPSLPFALDDGERDFLNPAISSGKSKNISLDPSTGKLQGISIMGEKADRLARMIDRFGRGATALVTELLGYKHFERARTSYRPVEIEGRAYSPTNDDRLLHVDAFPSRPMKGKRILRVFSNVAPEEARQWKVGEPFLEFAEKFLPRVGPSLPGKSWLFGALGVTHGVRSRYDEVMLSLHDACKLDAAYQKNGPQAAVSFPPGTSWMVFTDQVLHAASGGAFALEQTFHFDIAEMAEPERSPLRVLERLTGRALV